MDHPQQAKAKAKAKGAAAAPPLYGDVLDAVVSRVPALDLVPASRVSRQWRRAVRSSVSSSSRLSPWLLLHPLKPRRSPTSSSSSSYAFDPHSRTWLHGLLLPPHSNNNNNNNHYSPAGLLLPVVARGGSRLCALSFSAVSVSADPFGAAAWRRFDAPRVWRQDPVVALAGPHLVVLGGAYHLALADGDAAASVEVLLTDSSSSSSDCTSSSSSSCWQPCEPMPAAFDGSTSALWLSAAASERRVYVVERRTGRASWLDPASRTWGPVRLLRPDGCPPDVSSWAAGGTSERDSLILAGVSGKRKKNFVKVNVWEVEGDSLEIIPGRKDQMPQEMADRLFLNCSANYGDDADIQEEEDYCGWPCLIGLCAAGDCGYVYNQAEPRKGMVMYEVERDTCKAGMIRRWEWVPCPAALQQDHRYYYYAADKVALGCSPVGLDDLAAALTSFRAR